MHNKLALCLIASLTFSILPACGDDDDDDDGSAGSANAGRGGTAGGNNAGNGGSTAGTTNGGRAGGGNAGSGMAGAAAGAPSDAGGAGGSGGAVAMLTDPEIIHVLDTANTGEVAQGKIAQMNAQDMEVQEYADMMVEDHTKANDMVMMVAEENDLLPPDPNPVSATLKADSDMIIMQLEAAASDEPAEFDFVYMQSQVTAHSTVLAIIDGQLLPEAEDPQLTELLMTLRTDVAAHLELAQTILDSLDPPP